MSRYVTKVDSSPSRRTASPTLIRPVVAVVAAASGTEGGLPQGGCFIAHGLVYGLPLGEHLDAFRGFRDGVLLKTAPGTAMVEAYYTLSPAVADMVAEHPALALLVRVVLTPLAWAIEAPLFAALVLLVAVSGRALRARRVAARASQTR